MWIGSGDPFHVGEHDVPEELKGAPAPLCPCQPAMGAKASEICWPTLRIGFNAARGFWKIIEIADPRSRRILGSVSDPRSWPK